MVILFKRWSTFATDGPLSQLTPSPSCSFSLLYPTHFAFAQIKGMSFYGGQYVSLKIFFQFSHLALKVAARVAAFPARVATSAAGTVSVSVETSRTVAFAFIFGALIRHGYTPPPFRNLWGGINFAAFF